MIDQKIILKRAELILLLLMKMKLTSFRSANTNVNISSRRRKKAEEALGQSIKSFRREFWYEMRDRLLSEKYQQQLINNI